MSISVFQYTIYLRKLKYFKKNIKENIKKVFIYKERYSII